MVFCWTGYYRNHLQIMIFQMSYHSVTEDEVKCTNRHFSLKYINNFPEISMLKFAVTPTKSVCLYTSLHPLSLNDNSFERSWSVDDFYNNQFNKIPICVTFMSKNSKKWSQHLKCHNFTTGNTWDCVILSISEKQMIWSGRREVLQ